MLCCHSREGGNLETIIWIPGLHSQAAPPNPRMTEENEVSGSNNKYHPT